MPRLDGGLAEPTRLAFLLILLLSPSAVPGVAAPARVGPRPAAAAEMRLPPDHVYARAVGADRAVVFSHGSHVAFERDGCTGCHPQLFPMLKLAPEPTHRAMDVGRSCGACHDGKKAFGVRDSASYAACHSGMRTRQMAAAQAAANNVAPAAARPVPKPHAFPRGADSPGVVTFRHATHLRGAGGCRACHPRPFRMAPAPPTPGGGMHGAGACGACHDGKRAFAADDSGACARCHAEAGGQR